MMRGLRHLSFLIVLVAAFALSRPLQCLGHDMALATKDMRVVPIGEMVKDARTADIVFVGEMHDSKEHHDAQLNIIRGLEVSGARIALGLEMFRADRQEALDRWVSGEMLLKDFMGVYSEHWELPWDLYEGIFLYSRKKGIPLVGLNVPKDISKKVSKYGFSSLSSEDLRKLPSGLSCDVDENYMDYIRKAHKAHGQSGKGFVNFCEAQLMWDKVMARRLIEYLKKNPGTTVVVLAGSVHAWKKGIPDQIRKQSNLSYKVILPLTPDTGPEFVNEEYADYFMN